MRRSRLANDLKLNIQVSEMFESDSGAGAKNKVFDLRIAVNR
jgi:hypothetical protein